MNDVGRFDSISSFSFFLSVLLSRYRCQSPPPPSAVGKGVLPRRGEDDGFGIVRGGEEEPGPWVPSIEKWKPGSNLHASGWWAYRYDHQYPCNRSPPPVRETSYRRTFRKMEPFVGHNDDGATGASGSGNPPGALFAVIATCQTSINLARDGYIDAVVIAFPGPTHPWEANHVDTWSPIGGSPSPRARIPLPAVCIIIIIAATKPHFDLCDRSDNLSGLNT